ncbi:uncharacterized protein RAG0_01987 [Rhynchosporium agropyri]|uniref:Uncharacterized protein n=1 Tax=Rhynchosporium agropyri TaxID=914238 RepID=A0A1E1JZJ8_9HELO|nr:uncharacterized protein RAG0_01987 [Rhynchosporium agropyri]
MFRNDNDNRHNGSRSASPPAMRRQIPASPPDPTSRGFGGARHGFNSSSYYGRTIGIPNMTYRLPPITATRPAHNHFVPIRHYTGQAAQRRTSSSAALGADIGMSSTGREDTDMTTPDPLQRPSQYDGITVPDQVTNPLPHICFCNRNGVAIQNHSPIDIATEDHENTRPYHRLSVSDILNHSPLPGTQAQNGEASSAPNTGNSSDDTDHPMLTPPRSIPAHSEASRSSISSDRTQRPPFDTIEKRCYLLNTVYHICMDATSTYIINLRPATRNRHNQLPRHRNHGSTRYQPYQFHRCGRDADSTADLHARRRTLMDNISSISTYIWRRARSDEMAPHRAEGDAVHAMRGLYRWSEIVVRGIESDGREDGVAAEGPHVGDIMGMKVAVAAKDLCRWLGDDGAWNHCCGVMNELRELSEKGKEGEIVEGRIREVYEESEGGNIT